MNAEAGLALRSVLGALGGGVKRPAWRAAAAAVRAAQEKHRDRALEYGGKPIDPRRAQMALAKVLPENTIITNDAGSAASYVYEYQRFGGARSFVAPQDLAAIGIGYPLGLGAKLARPHQKVVTISGDGAFLCNGAELETAMRENLPTVCVILNNFNLGSERAYQKHFYDGRYIADVIGNPRVRRVRARLRRSGLPGGGPRRVGGRLRAGAQGRRPRRRGRNHRSGRLPRAET